MKMEFGTVEVVLLILVATGLVLIFKDRITELVTNIFWQNHVPGREDMRQKAEKYADVHRAVSCVDKPGARESRVRLAI